MTNNKQNKQRINTMKTLLSVLLVLGFYFAGCTNEQVISSSPLQKETDYSLIKLPTASGLQINNIYSDSKWISGSQGGSLNIQGSYSGGIFGTVTVNSTLVFTAGSFSGSKNISMTADDEYCSSSFLPGMSFSAPAIYNITYTGIDLTGINPAHVTFVYLKTDGTLEYPLHEGITVDATTGKISVKNAKLNHFSRYGFVNKEDE